LRTQHIIQLIIEQACCIKSKDYILPFRWMPDSPNLNPINYAVGDSAGACLQEPDQEQRRALPAR